MQTRCARPSEMARDPRAGRRQAASAPDRRNPRATSCGPLLRQAVALLLTALTTACGKQNTLDLQYYYEYDRDLPLQVRTDSLAVRKWHISFDSVHQQRVPAVLTLPARGTPPYPAVIMLHGLGDHKEQDYMAIGDSIFSAAGFAVLRPDFALHGERRVPDLGEKTLAKRRYTFRDAIAQTVFDLRRAVDYLETRTDIDPRRTGFLGISLGGIAGTVFCGVEPRVEYSMLVLAGGGLRWAFGTEGTSSEIGAMLAPVEPVNFVGRIAPRPVLFLNAELDEVVPKTAALLLHAAAGDPKKVIWYDAGHKMPPVPAFEDCKIWLRQQIAQRGKQ